MKFPRAAFNCEWTRTESEAKIINPLKKYCSDVHDNLCIVDVITMQK